ncbi:MAG: hypothetical protein VW257_04620 [Quisquiliibacterium sp.]
MWQHISKPIENVITEAAKAASSPLPPYLIEAAAMLWNCNNNTLQIARVLKCHESEVYANLDQIKRVSRQIKLGDKNGRDDTDTGKDQAPRGRSAGA